MTIAAECSDCGTVFRVSEEHAGRRFRCKSCGATCQVPDTGSSERKSAPPRKKRRAASSAPKKRAPEPASVGDEWEQDDYGFDGYEQYEDYEYYEESEDYLSYSYTPSRRRSTRRSRGAGKRTSARSRGSSAISDSALRILKGVGAVIGLLVLVPVVLFLSVMFGDLAPQLAGVLGLVLVISGYLGMFVSNIVMMVQAFREETVVGLLFLFVPGYALYFVASRWDEVQKSFFACILGLYVTIAGIGLAAGARP